MRKELELHPDEILPWYGDVDEGMPLVRLEQDLVGLPLLQRIAQTAGMNAEDLADVLEREKPLRVSGINPLFGLLKESSLVRLPCQKIGLIPETRSGFSLSRTSARSSAFIPA